MTIRLYSKKGSALLLMVMVTLTAIALALAILSGVAMNSIMELREEALWKADYIALAGIDYARYIITSCNPASAGTWPRGAGFNGFGGNIAITISGTTSPYTVTSKGTFSSASKTLKANVNSTGAIISWI